MEGTSKNIKIKKGRRDYIFDRKIKSRKVNLYAIKIVNNKAAETSFFSMDQVHEMLGHPSEEITKATARKLNIKTSEKMTKCEHCDVAKMKKRNISKSKLDRAEKAGERIFLDISSIQYPSAGGSRFWGLFLDDYSDFLFGVYMRRKSDLAPEGIKLIKTIENNYRINIDKIRCNNVGKNKSLEKEIIDKDMKITFEYTAANTPQQNRRIERNS